MTANITAQHFEQQPCIHELLPVARPSESSRDHRLPVLFSAISDEHGYKYCKRGVSPYFGRLLQCPDKHFQSVCLRIRHVVHEGRDEAHGFDPLSKTIRYWVAKREEGLTAERLFDWICHQPWNCYRPCSIVPFGSPNSPGSGMAVLMLQCSQTIKGHVVHYPPGLAARDGYFPDYIILNLLMVTEWPQQNPGSSRRNRRARPGFEGASMIPHVLSSLSAGQLRLLSVTSASDPPESVEHARALSSRYPRYVLPDVTNPALKPILAAQTLRSPSQSGTTSEDNDEQGGGL